MAGSKVLTRTDIARRAALYEGRRRFVTSGSGTAMTNSGRICLAAVLLLAAAQAASGQTAPPSTLPPVTVTSPPQQPGTLRPVPPLQIPAPASPAPVGQQMRAVPQISIPIGQPANPVPAPPDATVAPPSNPSPTVSQRATLARCDALQGSAAREECRRRVFVGATPEPVQSR